MQNSTARPLNWSANGAGTNRNLCVAGELHGDLTFDDAVVDGNGPAVGGLQGGVCDDMAVSIRTSQSPTTTTAMPLTLSRTSINSIGWLPVQVTVRV